MLFFESFSVICFYFYAVSLILVCLEKKCKILTNLPSVPEQLTKCNLCILISHLAASIFAWNIPFMVWVGFFPSPFWISRGGSKSNLWEHFKVSYSGLAFLKHLCSHLSCILISFSKKKKTNITGNQHSSRTYTTLISNTDLQYHWTPSAKS